MTLFLGHSTAFRILRSLDRASLLNASQAVPRSQGIPTLAKKNTLHPALAGKPLPFDVIVPDEKKQEANRKGSATTSGNCRSGRGAFSRWKRGFILRGQSCASSRWAKNAASSSWRKSALSFAAHTGSTVRRTSDFETRNRSQTPRPLKSS